MSESEPFQLNASAVKPGETLLGELILGEATPGLNHVRRVVIRVRGELEHLVKGSPRRKELSGGPEFIWERPFRGELRIPFTLSLPPDAPPSYQGQSVQITWEIVASLQDEDGKELLSWSQPIQLQSHLTARHPVWLDRPAPPVASPPGFFSRWEVLFFPAMFCFCMPGTALVRMFDGSTRNSVAEKVIVSIVSLAMLALGVIVIERLVRNARAFTVASLVPLAERFPRGAPARVRLFLQLTKPLTVREAKLQLTAYEEHRPIRSTGEVAVQLPGHLAEGQHQFDVEFPIPRDFPPTFEKCLTAQCTLTLAFNELGVRLLSTRLVLAPEVLEEGIGSTGAS